MKARFQNPTGLVLVLFVVAACISCGKFGFPYDDCVPDCTSRACGPDGCGGSCLPGCDVGEICNETMGQCERCIANCDGRECGLNECGISCGDCSVDASCSDGICVCDFVDCDGICCVSGEVCYAGSCCNADCTGRDCGADGCGGTCGVGCVMGETCNPASGQCEAAALGDFVTIGSGSFEMGSLDTEVGRYGGEVQHTVTLTRSFIMQNVEVTQEQYVFLRGFNPSSNTSCGLDCPVEDITWHEAASYCNALSLAEGFERCYNCHGSGLNTQCGLLTDFVTPYDCLGYRLPTLAEWEYAARAGTITATYNGDLDEEYLDCEQPNDVLDTIAWFCGNSVNTIHPVGMKVPNSFGLYDMLGNVSEWCQNWDESFSTESVTDPWGPAEGTYRRCHGGSCHSLAKDIRAADLTGYAPLEQRADVGFRPVRTLP